MHPTKIRIRIRIRKRITIGIALIVRIALTVVKITIQNRFKKKILKTKISSRIRVNATKTTIIY